MNAFLQRRFLQGVALFISIFSCQMTLQAQALTVETSITADCVCPEGNRNFIDLTVTGGVPPYRYDWSSNGAAFDCQPAVDFSALDNTACPAENAAGCPVANPCTDVSDAINAQMYQLQGATLTVSAPDPQGGACIDENEINDSHLNGTVAIKTGVTMNAGNTGPTTNVTRTWTFSQPICNLEVFVNDLDDQDGIIVNASLGGSPVTLGMGDYILTNTTAQPACPALVAPNNWESQCPNTVGNTDRGGFIIVFPSCVDEIDFVYYAEDGGGGSYSLGFSASCAQDLECVPNGDYQVIVTDANGDSVTQNITGNSSF